jgi:hypothetical protein
MILTLDGKTEFPSEFTYRMRDIITALEGRNPLFKSQLVRLVVYQGRPRPTIEMENPGKGRGIYVIGRDNPLTPAENFLYFGSTISMGHEERLRKILSHAANVVGKGDNVLPISRFIRDNCNKNLQNIRTIFIPLDWSDRDIRDMEMVVVNHMKSVYGHLVKNERFGKAPTRPAVREPVMALEGI